MNVDVDIGLFASSLKLFETNPTPWAHEIGRDGDIDRFFASKCRECEGNKPALENSHRSNGLESQIVTRKQNAQNFIIYI